MIHHIQKAFSLLFIAVLFLSCSSDDDGQGQATVSLEVLRLQELENTLEYEAWLVVGGENFSIGRFTDVSFPKTFRADPDLIDRATSFKLSIEPGNDPSPAISNTVLLSGTFAGNAAQLTINETIGSFVDASGVFMLKTPTDNVSTNEESGIYWQRADGTAGLSLPALPAGWNYEGWVTVPTPQGDVNLSTGTFRSPVGQDDFLPYSMTANPPPPYPGEDFLNLNLLSRSGVNSRPDLRGKRAFISIEPNPDNDGGEPFILQPLSGIAGEGLAPEENNMRLETGSFPLGSAVKD